MARTNAGRYSQHTFSEVPNTSIQRSTFDRSCNLKTTFSAGDLIPIFIDEALPGDTMKMRSTLFSRISTMLFPIMSNVYLDVFWFSVPNRLVWDNWERFNGAQDDPDDSTDFLVPTISANVSGHLEGSLSDYLGVPTEINGLTCMSLYHRAYNLI